MSRSARPEPIEERSFHHWLSRHLAAGRGGMLPIGDDVAAIPLAGRRVALLTTDALSEGTHFLRDSDPGLIGEATAAVSLSDIAAKGGVPIAGLLDLLLPPGTRASWAQAVARGADRMGRRFGAPIVGGDTKPATGRSVVGTFVGFGRSDRLAPRSGARPGDWVVVTGTVGGGGAAARMLHERGRRREALAALLHVRPRVAEGQRLIAWAHAMTDTSDGLAAAARLVSAASRRRVDIDIDSIPWDRRLVAAIPRADARVESGFYGGDYELFATISPRSFPAARRAARALGCRLTVIGRVRTGRGAWLVSRGAPARPMPPEGWNPFGRTRT